MPPGTKPFALRCALKKAGVEAQLEVVPGGHGIVAPPGPEHEIYQSSFKVHLGNMRIPG